MANRKKTLYAWLLLIFAVSLGAATPSNVLPPRTELEVKQGKENVKQVVQELTDLFNLDSLPVSLPKFDKPVSPAYCKVITSDNKRATIIFRPRFTTAKQMFRALDGIIYGQVYIEMIQEQNIVTLSAPEAEIESYRAIMEAMDVPTAQVLIEAKIVEVSFKDGMQRNFKFKWDNQYGGIGTVTQVPGVTAQPTSGLNTAWTFTSGKNSFSFDFKWLLTAQDARILSSPNILVTRNEVSRIVTGSDIPIQEANTTSSTTTITTKFKRVGVSLEVEPVIINDDNVTLRLYPSVSNVSENQSIQSGSYTYTVPVISIRNVESRLRLRDGQIAMLGGLYTNATRLEQQRIPFVSDIPYIGELFTGKNYSQEVNQLIFFIKVRVIPPANMPKTMVGDPDRHVRTSESLGLLLQSNPEFPARLNTVEKLAKELIESRPGSRERTRRKVDAEIEQKLRDAAEKK